MRWAARNCVSELPHRNRLPCSKREATSSGRLFLKNSHTMPQDAPRAVGRPSGTFGLLAAFAPRARALLLWPLSASARAQRSGAIQANDLGRARRLTSPGWATSWPLNTSSLFRFTQCIEVLGSGRLTGTLLDPAHPSCPPSWRRIPATVQHGRPPSGSFDQRLRPI
jgi:hypothetical protein